MLAFIVVVCVIAYLVIWFFLRIASEEFFDPFLNFISDAIAILGKIAFVLGLLMGLVLFVKMIWNS